LASRGSRKCRRLWNHSQGNIITSSRCCAHSFGLFHPLYFDAAMNKLCELFFSPEFQAELFIMWAVRVFWKQHLFASFGLYCCYTFWFIKISFINLWTENRFM